MRRERDGKRRRNLVEEGGDGSNQTRKVHGGRDVLLGLHYGYLGLDVQVLVKVGMSTIEGKANDERGSKAKERRSMG